MRNSLITLLLLVVTAVPCFAVGSPDFLPDGAHPRIWLDATELSRLRAAKVANSTEWAALNTWLGSNYPATNYDVKTPSVENPGFRSINWDGHSWVSYRGLGWLENITNYALAYQILKSTDLTLAEQYGNHCIDIVNGMIAVHSVGEEVDNGILMMRAGDATYNFTNNSAEVTAASLAGEYIMPNWRAGKYGYSARAMIALPLAYDWLYDLLSQADRTLWQDVMFRYFDWSRGVTSTYNDGVVYGGVRYHEQDDGSCNGTTDICTTVAAADQQGATFNDDGNNFFSGFFEMMTLIGVATYGDNVDAAAYHTYAKQELWENRILTSWNSTDGYKGGDAPEGWNYGAGWFRDFQAMIGVKTATGYNPFDDTDFPREVIQSFIHSNASNLTDMVAHGQWSTTAQGKPYEYHVYAAMAADQEDGGTYSPYAQWFMDNANFVAGTSGGTWEKLIFYRPEVSADPTADFPVFYENEASGLVTMRSSWTDAADTITSYWQLGKGKRNDHENYDEGNFDIIRGNDKLLWGDGMTTEYNRNSTIDFGGTGQLPYGTAWTVAQPISGLENSADYLYTKANIVGGYQKNYYPSERADLYNRSMIYLKPNVWIVSDVTHTDPTIANKWKDWMTVYPGVPTTDVPTQTVTFTNGGSKSFVKTLYPLGVGYSVEAAYSTWTYRAEMRPTSVNEYDQFLHVIEATDSAATQTATSLISGTGTRGALIDTTAAMFTTSPTGTDIAVASYTADATTHYIADVPPLGTVVVTKDAVAIPESPITASAAGLITFTTTAGSADYVITTSAAPVCEVSNGGIEICGDDIDQDCDGFDLTCPPVSMPISIHGSINGLIN